MKRVFRLARRFSLPATLTWGRRGPSPAFMPLIAAAIAAAVVPACNSDSERIGEGKKLVVTVTKGDVGTAADPLAVSVGVSTPFDIHIEAHLPDGTVDTSFNGYVNVEVQPGTITDLGKRNVQLQSGQVDIAQLPVSGAFGEAHVWAQDIGYEPESPAANPPPQCSDGIDNNNNGLIDYPADPGCYAPVDNSEDLGEYASGVSETLYFQLPRIALVRGYNPAANGNGNATSFPQQQISVDTGWRGDQNYAFSTVVIGLTAAGFYVQDLQNDLGSSAPGYGGLYAYNFSTPSFMRVCDRVQILSGTSSDFYGFTELNYPTWQIEYWNPAARPCMVPEPTNLSVDDLLNNNRLWQTEATLVRVQTAGTRTVHVAKHFGPGDVQVDNARCLTGETPPCYVPDATHSNCDFNHTGKIDFNDPAESACADACAGSCSASPFDPECSEYSQYASQNDFELVVDDPNSMGGSARVQVNGAAANGYDPLAVRGQSVRAFTGLVAYFSGGCQFTLNARCSQDIIQPQNPGDPTEPLASDVACVHPRTLSDINDTTQ
jgi:hypothetical protein